MKQDNPELCIVNWGQKSRLTVQEIKLLTRRQAVEPIIGHLKYDYCMGQCHLNNDDGDRLHVVLFAAGYSIDWLLRIIAQKGLRAFVRSIEMTAIATGCHWLHRILNLISLAGFQSLPRLAWIRIFQGQQISSK